MLKKSATTVPKMAHEAGIGHTLRLPRYELAEIHDEYVAKLKLRRLKVPKKAAFQKMATANQPQAKSQAERAAWIRSEIKSDKDKNATCSLRISSLLVSKGTRESRNIGSEQQLLHWATLWDDKKIDVRPACGGLGLFALETLPGGSVESAGCVVARGETDPSIWWPELESLVTDTDGMHAALLGPISLINAACKKHANAEFVFGNGNTIRAVCTREVQAGEQILVQYPCAGVRPCKCDVDVLLKGKQHKQKCGRVIEQWRDGDY